MKKYSLDTIPTSIVVETKINLAIKLNLSTTKYLKLTDKTGFSLHVIQDIAKYSALQSSPSHKVIINPKMTRRPITKMHINNRETLNVKETYLYFAENESADAAGDSHVYPASTFTGIDPISATSTRID